MKKILFSKYWMVIIAIFAITLLPQLIFVGNTISKRNEDIIRIDVYIPNYNNEENLEIALNLLQQRQSKSSNVNVRYVIFTQEEDENVRKGIKEKYKNRAEVYDLVQPGRIGGAALPGVFKAANQMNCGSNITIFSDTDAFMLANNWDLILIKIFENKNIGLASINPRGGNLATRWNNLFKDVAEWNWMAYKTELLRDDIMSWTEHLPFNDWGHWFTDRVYKKGFGQYLWNTNILLFEGKSPIVSGDQYGNLWVLHFFYSSRIKSEKNLQEDSKHVVTPAQKEALLKWASQSLVTYPSSILPQQ